MFALACAHFFPSMSYNMHGISSHLLKSPVCAVLRILEKARASVAIHMLQSPSLFFSKEPVSFVLAGPSLLCCLDETFAHAYPPSACHPSHHQSVTSQDVTPPVEMSPLPLMCQSPPTEENVIHPVWPVTYQLWLVTPPPARQWCGQITSSLFLASLCLWRAPFAFAGHTFRDGQFPQTTLQQKKYQKHATLRLAGWCIIHGTNWLEMNGMWLQTWSLRMGRQFQLQLLRLIRVIWIGELQCWMDWLTAWCEHLNSRWWCRSKFWDEKKMRVFVCDDSCSGPPVGRQQHSKWSKVKLPCDTSKKCSNTTEWVEIGVVRIVGLKRWKADHD